jgi:hypothetical protein
MELKYQSGEILKKTKKSNMINGGESRKLYY